MIWRGEVLRYVIAYLDCRIFYIDLDMLLEHPFVPTH